MIYRKIIRLKISKNISNKLRKSRILQSRLWGYISLDQESNECREIISRNDNTEFRGSRYLLVKLDSRMFYFQLYRKIQEIFKSRGSGQTFSVGVFIPDFWIFQSWDFYTRGSEYFVISEFIPGIEIQVFFIFKPHSLRYSVDFLLPGSDFFNCMGY